MRRLSCLTAVLLVAGLWTGTTRQPTAPQYSTMSATRSSVAVSLPAPFPIFQGTYVPKVESTTVPATVPPTTVARAVVQPAATTVTTVRPATRPASKPVVAAPVSGSGLWWCIGNHESHNVATTNTGNGYYGAFQFSASTWNAMNTGYARADLAPYSVQLAAAQQAAARGGLHNQFPSSSRACGG